MDQKGIRLDDIKGADNANGVVQGSYVKDEEFGPGKMALVEGKYQGTVADRHDMSVLGRDQVLRVSTHDTALRVSSLLMM